MSAEIAKAIAHKLASKLTKAEKKALRLYLTRGSEISKNPDTMKALCLSSWIFDDIIDS